MAMASPGQKIVQALRNMNPRASEIISPHSGAGGREPRPRKLRVASSMIAKATRIVASTMTGASTLGSTSRAMIQPADSPRATAAAT